MLLTHGASSNQVYHEDKPTPPEEHHCMDHLHWNAAHLYRNSCTPSSSNIFQEFGNSLTLVL